MCPFPQSSARDEPLFQLRVGSDCDLKDSDVSRVDDGTPSQRKRQLLHLPRDLEIGILLDFLGVHQQAVWVQLQFVNSKWRNVLRSNETILRRILVTPPEKNSIHRLYHLLEGLPVSRIGRLNLSHCNVCFADLPLDRIGELFHPFSRLTYLDLSFCKDVTDAVLETVLPGLRNLLSLHLSFCSNIGGSSSSSHPSTASIPVRAPELEMKETVGEKNDREMSAALCPVLQELVIRGCSQMTGQTLRKILCGTSVPSNATAKLRVLNMAFCYKIEEWDLLSLQNCLCDIESLNLGNCWHLMGSGIQTFLVRLPKLRHLSLFHCPAVQDKMLLPVFASLPFLESVNLDYCYQIRGTCFETISSSVTRLDLQECKLSDIECSIMLQNAPRLRYLDLSLCHGLSNTGLSPLICSTSLRLLHHLDISYCHQINDQFLFDVVRHLLALSYLNLSHCPGFTTEGVLSLKTLECLQKIVLVDCTDVDREKLHGLPCEFFRSLLF